MTGGWCSRHIDPVLGDLALNILSVGFVARWASIYSGHRVCTFQRILLGFYVFLLSSMYIFHNESCAFDSPYGHLYGKLRHKSVSDWTFFYCARSSQLAARSSLAECTTDGILATAIKQPGREFTTWKYKIFN